MARPYRVLLVSSSGGVLLDLLALEPWWSRHDPVWAVVRAPDTEGLLTGAHPHWLSERSSTHVLGVIGDVAKAAAIIRKERPDVLISAGTGCAVGFFIAAKALRVPSLWLTTLNLVATPGLADRVCSYLASRIILQQESMLATHPTGVVVGELY